MTCEHVVGRGEEATIVFYSGQKNEVELEAQVVATDPDRDLACLRVKDVKDAPAPLELGAPIVLKETETVFAAGFPFGKSLAGDKKNPEIAISKSNVSSIRKDNSGRVLAVQLSGDINPGNSGGPIVTTAGKVAGVAQSKILGTFTAFAVPPEEIQGFLRGRIKGVSFEPSGVSATETKLSVAVTLVDPLATLTSVGIVWIRADQVAQMPAEAGEDGKFGKLSTSMSDVSLKIEEDRATGAFLVKRVASDPTGFGIVFQPYFTPLEGSITYCEPSTLQVAFEGAAGGTVTAGGAVNPLPAGEAVKPVKPEKAVTLEAVTERDDQGRSYLRVVSTVEKINLGAGLLQLLSAPSGRFVYALYKDQAVVKVFDPANWSPVKEITTPRFPVSMWCDERRVVVVCPESKVITFLDPEAGKPVKSVPIRDKDVPTDFLPLRVVGKAPDGSLMTLWKGNKAGPWDTWLYQLQEDGQARRILKGELQWTCYAGARTLLGQSNFRGSPSGVPELFDVPTGKRVNLGANRLFGERGWDTCFTQIFQTFDRGNVVLPTLKIGGEGYGYQTWTYVADPELTRFSFDFPGAAFAEVPSEGILVSWGLVYKEKERTTPKPEVFYVSRSNGRVIRRIATKNYEPHPAQYQYVNPDRTVAYVPGHELVVATDSDDRKGLVWVIRCGPVAPDAKVGADPGITVTNDPPLKATVGEEVAYAPAFARPAMAKSLVFKLKKGPEEIKLDPASGRFTWKPTDAYIGKFDIEIVAEVDGAQVPVVAWTIEVGF
ncbi:MAG: trypsin-like peptidase domain-containing protein [Planctomycetes bacterium]|nr:trypsin-like peptidase domain-containing protein [Planctomycetota bacterium]